MQSFYKLMRNLKPAQSISLCKHGKAYCHRCTLKEMGACRGCHSEKAYETCEQQACMQGCLVCQGHKVAVPGLCCRNPVRDIALSIAGVKQKFEYKQQEPLKLPHHGIPVCASSFFKEGSAFHPDVKVVAVGVTSVLSRKGFYSEDYKDYLSLPKDVKLILLTTAIDDILEYAWDKDLFKNEYELSVRGFDYWMPLFFSSYERSSKMNQLWQNFRTMQSAVQCSPHFSSAHEYMNSYMWENYTLPMIEKIPNVAMNAQFLADFPEMKTAFIKDIVYLHRILPPHVTFSFIGATSLAAVMNYKAATKGRVTYFFSSTPWMAGIRGYTFTSRGTQKKDMSIPRIEVMRLSQRNYMTMCDRRPEDHGL